MQSPPAAPRAAPPRDAAARYDVDAPTVADGAAAWSALTRALHDLAAVQARVVTLAGEVQRSGTIERLEGMPLAQVLALTHRLTGADRGMVLTAAEVLRDMPATQQLFDTAVLSWSQVRGIVTEARRLPKAGRARLDAMIGASRDLFAKLDPDDAVDAVAVEARELRGETAAQRADKAAARGNYVYAQQGLFGRGVLHGEHDNVSLAAIVAGIDAAAPPDDGRTLGQRRADGLLALALHRCDDDAPCEDPACIDCHPEPATDAGDTGGGRTAGERGTSGDGGDGPEAGAGHEAGAGTGSDGGGAVAGRVAAVVAARRARVRCRGLRRLTPTADVTVLVDLRDVAATAAGRLLLHAPGPLPTISAAALESLAGHATVRAVLSDAARPLTVGRKVSATSLPDDVRLAVTARDRADRFPGSRRPIDHVHHTDRRGHGHHVDHLVGLAQPSHTRVHRHGWAVTLDPSSGDMTFSRGDRTWTTLPRGTRLRRPPPH